MEKEHKTTIVRNGTNISSTVPLALVEDAKGVRGEPFRWIDANEGAGLKIVRLQVSKETGREMARKHNDVVFLQEIRRTCGRSQYKVNMPKWIYKKKGVHLHKNAQIVWKNDLSGTVVFPQFHRTSAVSRIRSGKKDRGYLKERARRRAGTQGKMGAQFSPSPVQIKTSHVSHVKTNGGQDGT